MSTLQVHTSAVPGPPAAGGAAAGDGHLVALVLPVLRIAMPDPAPAGALNIHVQAATMRAFTRCSEGPGPGQGPPVIVLRAPG